MRNTACRDVRSGRRHDAATAISELTIRRTVLAATLMVRQILLLVAPSPIVWWLLVLCGCPKGIAAMLALAFTTGAGMILWTAIEGYELED